MASSGDHTSSPRSEGMKAGPSTPTGSSSSTESLPQGISSHPPISTATMLQEMGLESSSSDISGDAGERDSAGTQQEPVLGVEEIVHMSGSVVVGEGSTVQISPAREMSREVSGSSSASLDPEQFRVASRATEPISTDVEVPIMAEGSKDRSVEKPEKEAGQVSSPIAASESTPPIPVRRLDSEESIEVAEDLIRLRRSQRLASTPVIQPVTTSVPSTRRRTRALSALDSSEPQISPKRLRFEKGESSTTEENKFVSGSVYFDQDCADKGFALKDRQIIPERPVSSADFDKYGLVKFLVSAGLEKTITDFSSYSLDLVREFFANYKPGAHEVYLRGSMVQISPLLISQFYNLPIVEEEDPDLDMDKLVLEISGGTKLKWEVLGRVTSIKSINLTSKYAVLFRIGMSNWFPTRHQGDIDLESASLLYKIVHGQKFDMGKWIFQKLNKVASSTRGSQQLIFPCLLSSFILSTSDVDYSEVENMGDPEGEIKIHPRLLQPPHVMDLVLAETPAHVSSEERHIPDVPEFSMEAQTAPEFAPVIPGVATEASREAATESVYDKLIEDIDDRIAAQVALEEALTEQVIASRSERRKLFLMRRELVKLRTEATEK